MRCASLENTIQKFAMAGEQAGFTVEEMIDLLDHGMSVAELFYLISSRLQQEEERSRNICSSGSIN